MCIATCVCDVILGQRLWTVPISKKKVKDGKKFVLFVALINLINVKYLMF